MPSKNKTISTIPLADALIDFYKVNYINNLFYVLSFTGMSYTRYKKNCKSIGLPNPYIVNKISEGELIGFNLIHVATMSVIFKIPVTILLNMDMKAENIDLTKYKLYPKMYKLRKLEDEDYYIRIPMGSIESARKHGHGHLVSDIKKRTRRMKEYFNPFNL